MKITRLASISAVVLLAAVLGLGLGACQQQEAVAPLLPDRESVGFAADRDGATIEAHLSRPDGDGPFPAIVMQHGCGGLDESTFRALGRHAALLNDAGYVTLITDNFGPRGIAGCVGDFDKVLALYPVLVEDADPAFDYLASLPFVDADRIGFLGQSLGGIAALHAASRHDRSPRVARAYAASVAYYPHCWDVEGGYRFEGGAPLLILIGADDISTPTALCRDLADRWAEAIELVTYPDTHHGFDYDGPRRQQYTGVDGRVRAWGSNPEARKASQQRMLAFFGTHLQPAR